MKCKTHHNPSPGFRPIPLPLHKHLHIMRHLLYILLPGIFLFTQCSQAPLSGSVEMDPDWSPTLYLISPGSFDAIGTSFMGNLVDSATIGIDGHFAFHSIPENASPQLYELAIQKKGERFPTQLEQDDPEAANYLPLVYAQGDHLMLSAKAGNLQQTAEVTNASPANKAMLELRDIRMKAWADHINGAVDHTEDALLAKEKAFSDYRQALMDFAGQTDQLLPALTAIRWAGPTGDYERIPEFIVAQCEKWQAIDPGHLLVRQLCAKASREQLPVLIGDAIPDFQMPMLQGDTMSLHGLLTGKLNILDLWASWCIPCRHENREILVPLWQQYKDKGLQIIGYGLETEDKTWKNAIDKDQATWVQSSHLQGDEAPLFQALRIQTIPSNFLIDDQGKVIAKNIHGADLRKFVESYLK